MTTSHDDLEQQLNAFDPVCRQAALAALWHEMGQGASTQTTPPPMVNLHIHTFFSFNGYGYSPTYVAWKARKSGLYAAGIVDFDVLDGVDEFLKAARMVRLRACAGIETRVFVPEFADKEINSPGEPGIAYFMGVGFTGKDKADQDVLKELRGIAQGRNRGMLDRLNPYLDPICLDYDTEVLPLTPRGNATERHLCMAFDSKARDHFSEEQQLIAFWANKLDVDAPTVQKALGSPPVMQGLIRSKTMKAGGVGYVRPEGPDFPPLKQVAQFVKDGGAIPTVTYLDGTSEGEQDMVRLLEVCMEAGAAAVNIIPDRNWNIADPLVKAQKVANFNSFVAMAQERDLPIAVGTEMNAYGQPFVDDFAAPEMQRHTETFISGARIFWGHTLLQEVLGLGYLSPWAAAVFTTVAEKNRFYEALGKTAAPECTERLMTIGSDPTPQDILDRTGA